MGRYHVFAETIGGGKKVKIGECDYLSDAITKIAQMKVIHEQERKYCKFVVEDTTDMDRVAYYEVVH